MNIVAYCRVSTDKSDQLNSLETQKKFFMEYAEKNGHNLVKVYADEGISGTKTKNRKAFLQLMDDAKKNQFEMLVVKDISRFARNTVDLLQNVRMLKSLGIETLFLTANMTVLGQSEFVLTVFGALAQEESANMSKRVKFGKHMNAEKGRVPNIVYGYDKVKGDYFNLYINENEANIVRQIFRWYTEGGYGELKIAHMLNERGLKTKRNCDFSQHAIGRILTNEIYIGKVINGKEEVKDFLTGERITKEEDDWLVTIKDDLQIIDEETFKKAQNILRSRHDSFNIKHERQSNRHLFSTLIKCKNCGWSFRRVERKFKNPYIKWVCSGRNRMGTDSCPNATKIDESELIGVIQDYFLQLVKDKKKITQRIVNEFTKVYKSVDDNESYERELKGKMAKIEKMRQKYMDMYTDDLISREELNNKIGGMRTELLKIENELSLISNNIDRADELEYIIRNTFKEIEDITDVRSMTNEQMKRLIQKIEVDEQGNVDIYLKLFGDLGIDDSVLICDDRTQGCVGASRTCESLSSGRGSKGSGCEQSRTTYSWGNGNKGEIFT